MREYADWSSPDEILMEKEGGGGEATLKPALRAGGEMDKLKSAVSVSENITAFAPLQRGDFDYSACNSPGEAIAKLVEETGRSSCALRVHANIGSATWDNMIKGKSGIRKVTKDKLKKAFNFPDRLFTSTGGEGGEAPTGKMCRIAPLAGRKVKKLKVSKSKAGGDEEWIAKLKKRNKERLNIETGRQS
jgi:hypothetical protein